MAFLQTVRVRAYRSARDVELRVGPVTALVGEARSGKSNLLRAIRALLDPAAPPPGRDDLRGRAAELSVEARLSGGRRIALTARPPARPRARRGGAPPVLLLPAASRSGPLLEVDGYSDEADEAVRRFRTALREPPAGRSDSAGASALVAGIDACRESGITGVVFLIEEPELFLRPHTQRYLYRRLRALAGDGNQVLYSTHAPAFLNVARLEELVLVRYTPRRGTHIVQPGPLEADEAFRVVSEFDAERSEVFLARAAILVEGRTEKLVLPSIFAALGQDADRAQVSIVECGGKSNIPVFARICKACRIPYVVVHDRDAERGEQPIPAEIALNRLIVSIAGRDRTVVLEPDFEGITGLHGNANKPERAWEHFAAGNVEVPEPLERAVRLALRAAAR
ncbi:MAG TPA: TOPRIM nucleotidyl transferase/hydrolase domain-containing protein [Gaiellaceae bacterium]|nr:TOPRIM nucleotidyl transferase/hydrolase domain-containing protein [Gaiellaceae bacterium]